MMEASSSTAVSFTDLEGAAVSVPANRVPLYASLKGEQLATLTGIVANFTSGFETRLTENDIGVLSGLVSDLAHTSNQLVLWLTSEVQANQRRNEADCAGPAE